MDSSSASASPVSPSLPPLFPSAGVDDPNAGVLHRISTLAGKTLEPRDALQSILAIVIESFRAASGSISLLNPDTGKLETEVNQGLPPDTDALALRLGQGITGWVAFHGKPQLVRDVSMDPRYIKLRPEVRCEMAAPLLENNEQVLGVINLDSDQVGGFTEADLALFVRVTAEACAVMQRIWQLRQLQAKAHQLEALITIGQSLVTKLEPQELYDTVTREARQNMHCRACALYLHDTQRATVRFASLTSTAITDIPGGEMPVDSCAMAGPIHTRKQVEYANIQSPEFSDLIDLPQDSGLRSVLATPVLYENEVIGVLVVFTGHIHRFNNDEKRLCAALASLASVTLQNVRLYARVFQSEASLRKNEQLTTLGLLAAEIAHEIRNPLTVIKLLYGYLNLDFPEGDPRRTDVRVIGEKLDQLEAIVTRVLNFAKAPSSLHSRWNITDMIEDTIVLIRLKLAQNKIHLQFEPPARPIVIDAHKGQLQQVLLNVLLNSMHAMPDGGTITLYVGIEDRGASHIALVDITDTGTGIPDSIKDRIFDSFLSGRPGGTGLGLAIAKRILLSHHGDITLLSTSPIGTTMRITLPLAKA